MNRNSRKFGLKFITLLSTILILFSANLYQVFAQIAFESTRDGGSTDPVYDEIYIMNDDGSGLTRLTDSSGYDGVPNCSRDGAKITFESWRDGNKEIYIMNADGTEQINLTNNSAVDEAPSFSPDGTKIAFDSNRSGQFEIWVMNSDGTDLTQLTTNGGNFEPAWSPDGTQIVYEANNDIYVMNSDGSNPTQLTDHFADDGWPAWSPDGSKIAFVSNRDGNYEIYLMNADGTEQTNLTQSTSNDYYPSWSFDGTKIIFQSYRDGNYELYEMNTDGSRQTRLTVNDAYDEAPVFLPSIQSGQYALSFDGVNDRINRITLPSNPYCVELYFYVDQDVSSDSSLNTIFGSGSNMAAWLGKNSSYFNDETLTLHTKSPNRYTYTTTTIPAGWHHLAFNWNGSNYDFYLDGAKLITYQYNNGAALLPTTIYLGWRNFSDHNFKGKLDEIRIWGATRTEQEIQDNMNKQLFGSEANLMLYYRFDEGTGDTLTDSSPNGLDGTISGATWVPGVDLISIN